jgi:hypothetical protein
MLNNVCYTIWKYTRRFHMASHTAEIFRLIGELIEGLEAAFSWVEDAQKEVSITILPREKKGLTRGRLVIDTPENGRRVFVLDRHGKWVPEVKS